ncbi:hypothetical protein BJ508DRAFT_321259 [Ascobolus immersus RN42]|uniref:Uncharacterized protein n=1 Tax=Ascobolus immersus RN42 TaxID=1160509 RepID=A0A3N4IYC2_ASCIM|nr:hypothetical protein BJ508DRAFT_321259 [Ascobolus immersus RN42]
MSLPSTHQNSKKRPTSPLEPERPRAPPPPQALDRDLSYVLCSPMAPAAPTTPEHPEILLAPNAPAFLTGNFIMPPLPMMLGPVEETAYLGLIPNLALDASISACPTPPASPIIPPYPSPNDALAEFDFDAYLMIDGENMDPHFEAPVGGEDPVVALASIHATGELIIDSNEDQSYGELFGDEDFFGDRVAEMLTCHDLYNGEVEGVEYDTDSDWGSDVGGQMTDDDGDEEMEDGEGNSLAISGDGDGVVDDAEAKGDVATDEDVVMDSEVEDGSQLTDEEGPGVMRNVDEDGEVTDEENEEEDEVRVASTLFLSMYSYGLPPGSLNESSYSWID